MMDKAVEHLIVTGKLAGALVVAFASSAVDGVDLNFVITKILPVLLTIGAGYVLLFADSRYVRKSYFYQQKERIDQMGIDIAVMKEHGKASKEMLNRIEQHLRDLKNNH